MIAIKAKCAECGTPLWGENLNKRGDLYYCPADFERLSPEEKAENAKKVREYDDYKKMFDGSDSELVTDRHFSSSSGWVLNSQWTVSGGKASYDGTSTSVGIGREDLILHSFLTYRVMFTISNASGTPSINFVWGTTSSGSGAFVSPYHQFTNFKVGRNIIDGVTTSLTQGGKYLILTARSSGGSFDIDDYSIKYPIKGV